MWFHLSNLVPAQNTTITMIILYHKTSIYFGGHAKTIYAAISQQQNSMFDQQKENKIMQQNPLDACLFWVQPTISGPKSKILNIE